MLRLLLLLASSLALQSLPYNINLSPRQEIGPGAGAVFRGNESAPDHFKLLEQDGSSILVGARNVVYNLSLPDLRLQQRLLWESPQSTRLDCQHKGESEEVCQNYIRVLVKERDGRSLICGTNAFNPLCRLYALTPEGDYQVEREFQGTGICPYDPRHNSTATFLPLSGEIYAATVTDRAASDPLIYRRSIDSLHADHQLRTQRNDLNTLNQPDFVSSFTYGEHVYFWFREMGVESVNGGEMEVYARVGRVCRSDRGGPASHEAWAGGWTTFLKARLNCSLPAAAASFYFNTLESTSAVVEGERGEHLVYAVLTTPPSPVQMSAVCGFRMADVEAIFEVGQFRNQEVPLESLWLPVPKDRVPRPRPGTCTTRSTTLPHDTVNFIHKNNLMAAAVPNHFHQPLLIDNSMGAQLSQIAVHPGVEAVNGRRYDVLFVGTSAGRVLKVVVVDGAQSVVSESVAVFPSPIRNLLIYPEGEGRLVAVTETALRGLPLFNCARQTSCSGCLHLQDPYCAWDLQANACVGNGNGMWKHEDYVQSVLTGKSQHCPEGVVDPEFYAVNQPARAASGGGLYSPASMSIAIVVTLALALTLGFLAGFRFSLWRKMSDAGSTSSASDYDSHSMGISRLTRHDAAAKTHKLDIYSDKRIYGTSPERMMHKSLVEEVLGRADLQRAASLREGGHLLEQRSGTLGRPSTLLTHPHQGYQRTMTQSLHSQGTLPKDYRVKKVYV